MSAEQEGEVGRGTVDYLICAGLDMDKTPKKNLAWMQQLLKIRPRMGTTVALVPNAVQERYTNDGWKQERNIVLKARQLGISTWIAGQFFLRTITHRGIVTVQVAHTQEAAEQIFRIVHRFLANLPETLREGALKTAKASARRVVIPALDSEYLVETAGDRNAGRGLTINNLHCTELARWPGDAEETLYGLMATLAPGGTLAMESTPDGAWGCFWKEWRDAEKTGTKRHFFPWWMEGAYSSEAARADSLTEVERMLIEQHGLTLEQIGFRREIQEKFRGLAKQEYAEDPDQCFFASGSCYFETEKIDQRLPDVPQPVERRLRGELSVWLRAQPGRHYLLAIDPAGGGLEGDYVAMQVIDMEQAIQCAEYQGHLTPAETAVEAKKLGFEYNGALIVVERNSMGTTVLSCLHNDQDYSNVYRDERGEEGFLTSVNSRSRVLGLLYAALAQEPHKFLSERLLRECRSFVRLEGGRLEAKAGEHDDLVLAMAIALGARREVQGRKRAG